VEWARGGMITYRKRFGGLFLLLQGSGSSALRAVVPAAISAALALWMNEVQYISKPRNYMEHPYPYQIFAFLLGFGLVFRTNMAYARYQQAIQHASFMTSKWGDAALQTHNFIVATATTPSSDLLKAEVLRLFSLMHALAHLKFRGDYHLDHLSFDADSESIKGHTFPSTWEGKTIRVVGSDEAPGPLTSVACPNRSSDVKRYFARNTLPVLGGHALSSAEKQVLEEAEDKVFVVMRWLGTCPCPCTVSLAFALTPSALFPVSQWSALFSTATPRALAWSPRSCPGSTRSCPTAWLGTTKPAS